MCPSSALESKYDGEGRKIKKKGKNSRKEDELLLTSQSGPRFFILSCTANNRSRTVAIDRGRRRRGDGLINLFAVVWQKKCRSCSLVVGRVSLPQRTARHNTRTIRPTFFFFGGRQGQALVFLFVSFVADNRIQCQHFAAQVMKGGKKKKKKKSSACTQWNQWFSIGRNKYISKLFHHTGFFLSADFFPDLTCMLRSTRQNTMTKTPSVVVAAGKSLYQQYK